MIVPTIARIVAAGGEMTGAVAAVVEDEARAISGDAEMIDAVAAEAGEETSGGGTGAINSATPVLVSNCLKGSPCGCNPRPRL